MSPSYFSGGGTELFKRVETVLKSEGGWSFVVQSTPDFNKYHKSPFRQTLKVDYSGTQLPLESKGVIKTGGGVLY